MRRRFMMIYRYVLAEKSCGKYFWLRCRGWGLRLRAAKPFWMQRSRCRKLSRVSRPLSVLPVPLSTSFRTVSVYVGVNVWHSIHYNHTTNINQRCSPWCNDVEPPVGVRLHRIAVFRSLNQSEHPEILDPERRTWSYASRQNLNL